MRIRTITSASIVAGLVSACGGGGGVELYLMDAPPEGVTAVNLYVAAMQVHVAKAGSSTTAQAGWQSLSVKRSIDLVAHQGEGAAEVLGQLDLPDGKITQIRLVLDTSQPNTAVFNGESCDLDLSKVDKEGVKINHPFKALDAKSDKTYQVYVDVELDKSLKPEGNCFRLEPVVKLHKVKLDGAEVDVK
jgi:hypothetical protein